MHLLIDGKNLLYRGIYASLNSHTKDHFVAISRMMYSYFHQFVIPYHDQHKASDVHVFWDDKKENLWRRDIHPEYKDSSCRNKSSNVEDKLIKYQAICEDVWDNMGIKQYKLPRMEADDLIYAFCHIIDGNKMVVSNDGDMLQLPHKFSNVKVFNPSKKKICEKPPIDPVTFKCLDGDNSDNISGYYGIGPKKAANYSSCHNKLWELLSENGTEIFEKNRKLIDLALCPYLSQNIVYILKIISKPKKFDKKVLTELLYNKHKIKGIMVEYKTLISPFKLIGSNTDG